MYGTTGAALATTTTCTAADPGQGNILDLKYNFNLGAGDNGNVIGITNNRDATRSESFTYDALNRITTGQTSATSGATCWGQSYTIDQWGNLTNIGHVTGYGACSQGSLSVSATTSNQLSSTGFSYDGAGNMLTDGANTYTYNAESETTSAAGVTYTYDGDGNRVEKSNGRLFWYGAGSEILDESDLTGSITLEMVYFGGKRVAHRTSSNVIYYYEADMLGSARTIVQAGLTSPCYDADFLPFGGERVITNTCTQNYKFEGKKRDNETGNDDFGARFYRSNIGRWMSADWSSVPAPVPYANLTNPQTLNLYAMVSDNPETFADLDGHCGDNCDGQPRTDPSGSNKKVCDLKTDKCNDPATKNANGHDQDQAQQQSADTVTVEEVQGQGGNIFNHAAISVDGKQPVGLEQKKDCGTCAVEDRTTPGAVRPVDPKRKVLAKVTIHITHAQAGRIQTFLNRASKSPPNYNLYHSNCAEFCEAGLRAGGLKAPNDVKPGSLIDDLRKLYPQQ